jgi:hypothetical protein
MSYQERTFFMREGSDDRLLIPITDYSTMEGELCVICRESLTNRAAVRLPCGAVHRYHEECIERWLTENQNHTCAHCRQHFRILYYGEWTANDFVRYFVDYRPPPENE